MAAASSPSPASSPAVSPLVDDENLSDHPEIGAVRVRKKEAPAAPSSPAPEKAEEPKRAPLISGDEVSEPRVRKKDEKKKEKEPEPEPKKKTDPPAAAPPPPAPKPPSTPPTNDTVIEAARSDLSADSPDEPVAEDPAQLPERPELQALFNEFVKEKKAAGHDDVDLDFDAFQETILGECQRLVVEHNCKGVRFEVAVADGEVSLRPRLLR